MMPARGIGIVLADETRQKELFNQSSESVLVFADSLSARYNRVIIHLGQRFVFDRGNIYSSPQSKRNLQLFCSRIQQNKGEVILWLLDSHGSKKFKEVYGIHKDLIRVNLDSLRALNIPYDGIAVDLEWINLPRGNNNSEFAGIMKTWRDSLSKEKRLYYFATLIDDEKENRARGYDTGELARYANSPLAMLYVVESGFSAKKKKIVPEMSENRALSLLDYYQKQRWEICYSMHRAWYVVHKRKVVELLLPEYAGSRLVLKSSEEINRFLRITDFVFPGKIRVQTKNNKTIKINDKDRIVLVEATQPGIDAGYFIWEYFDFQNNFIFR